MDIPIRVFWGKQYLRLTTASPSSRQLLALQEIPLLGHDQHCLELVCFDLLEGDRYAEFQSSHQVQRSPDRQAVLGRLCGVELV